MHLTHTKRYIIWINQLGINCDNISFRFKKYKIMIRQCITPFNQTQTQKQLLMRARLMMKDLYEEVQTGLLIQS